MERFFRLTTELSVESYLTSIERARLARKAQQQQQQPDKHLAVDDTSRLNVDDAATRLAYSAVDSFATSVLSLRLSTACYKQGAPPRPPATPLESCGAETAA